MMNEAKHSLTVLLHDVVAGHLRLIEGKLSFRYSPEYLDHPRAQTLSFSLPLQAQAFDEPRSKAFFGGLLPEGKLRDLLSKQFGVSQQNDFALLREIGGECAGAVSLSTSADTLKPCMESSVKPIKWLSQVELENLVTSMPMRPMMAGQDGLRLSLAGAQDKLPVCVKLASEAQQMIVGLPTSHNPSTHIVKPAIPQIDDSVTNECFCMSLARSININVPSTYMVELQNKTVLIVERYDRTHVFDKPIERLHQEDFCQSLSISVDRKYQNEGGPSLRDCFKLVRQASSNSGTSILSLLDYVIFNALVGNHDAHGKNFSLLYKKGKTELAPLYDCLSTAIYPNLTSKMAMSIGGKSLVSA